MRYPAANQYPAPNSYPSAWWPPGLLSDDQFATLCDVFGVTVSGYGSEVGCPPTLVAVAPAGLLTVAQVTTLSAAVGLPAPSGVTVPEPATGVVTDVEDTDAAPVATSVSVGIPQLRAVASLAPFDAQAGFSSTDTEVAVGGLDTDALEPAFELEVAC